ncbi:MAG: signal peptide peptidase SppA [Alistipes sp.]|nr:signal peptide peptidase SppA [Alistipes sp.]
MSFSTIFGAALLAVVVGGVVKFLLWMGLFSVVGSFSSGSTVVVPEEAILKIDFAESILDAPSKDPMAGFDFATLTPAKQLTLYKTLVAIEAAKEDERIKGIYINITGGGAVSGTILEEMRAALADFKQSGKFIVAYNDGYSQWMYYLCSIADKIYIHPEGSFDWIGTSATSTFFKGLLDKLGVKVDILRPTVCKYKSAVEPYFLKEMSPANRAQMQSMVDSMWDVLTEAVSSSRNISVEELNKLANNLSVVLPKEAIEHKFVDAALYADEMKALFTSEYGIEEPEFVSLGDYSSSLVPDVKNLSAPQVAIVYANGNVMDGEGSDDNIYGYTLSKTIREVAEDDEIKAVVVRVNSPGGSALAADIIWREMKLLQEKKPVIISMGAYAASGGYYISAPADAIVADRMTLTGSIGVFGMLPTYGPALEKNLGITFDGVKTNAHADMGSGITPLDNTEHKAIMRSVDRVYERFTSLVAEGRNLPLEKVLEIAEGRVWMGSQAQQIGLVDTCGGIKAAIAIAIDKAALGESYRIVEVTDKVEGFAAILQSLNVKVRSAIRSQSEMGRLKEEFRKIEHLVSKEGVFVYCPYIYNFEFR